MPCEWAVLSRYCQGGFEIDRAGGGTGATKDFRLIDSALLEAPTTQTSLYDNT